MVNEEIDLDNRGKGLAWNWSEVQCLGHLHHPASTSLHYGSTHPWFMQFEGILMYFEGDPLVIFITPLYYLPPHIVIVPWSHASEG